MKASLTKKRPKTQTVTIVTRLAARATKQTLGSKHLIKSEIRVIVAALVCLCWLGEELTDLKQLGQGQLRTLIRRLRNRELIRLKTD